MTPITYSLVVSTPYLVGITHKTVGNWGYRYTFGDATCDRGLVQTEVAPRKYFLNARLNLDV